MNVSGISPSRALVTELMMMNAKTTPLAPQMPVPGNSSALMRPVTTPVHTMTSMRVLPPYFSSSSGPSKRMYTMLPAK